MKVVVEDEDEACIQKLWAEEECLDLDSVQFGTGEVVLLEVPALVPDEETLFLLRPKERTTIREAARLPGVTLSPGLMATASPPLVLDSGFKVTGGEGAASGTFGYVAVSRLTDERLIWLAFFLYSNPFVQLSQQDDSILAITNLGAKYLFPMSHPEQVQLVG